MNAYLKKMGRPTERQLLAALRELVECKDLKDRLDGWEAGSTQEMAAMAEEYDRRKPLARPAMDKHTPGPWYFDGEEDEGYEIFTLEPDDSFGQSICGEVLSEKDARLIVAAPKLLDVLRRLIDYINREGPPAQEWRAISALCDEAGEAIAKATPAAGSEVTPAESASCSRRWRCSPWSATARYLTRQFNNKRWP